tara:strand:+ start:194 stop:871 length:678 start_codon:yes stop_codon:yes gene_type:complete
MKHLLTIFFITALPLLSYGEYKGWFVEFQATCQNDEQIKGYVYLPVAHFNEDSVDNSAYLINHFDYKDNKLDDTITYFNELIKYRVISESNLDTIYSYTTIKANVLLASEIKSLRITNRISSNYIYFLSILDLSSDLKWIESKPVITIYAYGYFCDRTFYIHKETKKVKDVLKEIERYKVKCKKEDSELTEEELEKLQESRDIKLREFEDMLKGEKVVVSGSCTC